MGVPAVVVIEDAHWADQATLDVLRVLGRRVTSLPILALVTYREEAGEDGDALRVALGDLAGAAGITRIGLEPLSQAAVATLAEGAGLDAAELYRRTEGNPFYVTEVLQADDTSVPHGARRRSGAGRPPRSGQPIRVRGHRLRAARGGVVASGGGLRGEP